MTTPTEQAQGWVAWLAQFWPIASSLGLSALALVRFFWRRKDAAEKRHDDATRTEAEREARERIRQDAVDAAQIARHESEIERLYLRITETEKVAHKARRDADMGWLIGRHWHVKYCDLLSAARQYQHEVNNHLGSTVVLPPLVLPDRVPALEEPTAR